MAYVRNTKASDIKILSKILRKEDVREVEKLGYTPFNALRESFFYSDICKTIIHNNKPIGIFGVSISPFSKTFNKDIAVVGLLGSDEIKKIRFQFLRESEFWLTEILKSFDIAYSIIDCENALSIKWVEWLGFKLECELEINGHKFLLYLKGG